MRPLVLLAVWATGLSQADDRAWFTNLGTASQIEAGAMLAAEPLDSLRTKVLAGLSFAPQWQREASGLAPLLGLRVAADRLGDAELRVRARFPLIYALSDAGRTPDALSLANETNALAAALGDDYLLGESYLRLADLHLRTEPVVALEYLLKAERILPRSGPNASRIGRCWKFLGHVYHDLKRPKEAMAMFEKAAHHGALDATSRAESFGAIAAIALGTTGEMERAVKAAMNSAAQYEVARAWIAASKTWNAVASLVGDRFFDAWSAFENSRRCAEESKDDGARAEYSLNCSALLTRIGRPDEALSHLSFAKAYYLSSNDLKKVGDCLLNEGTAKASLDPAGGGLAQFEAASKMFLEARDHASLTLVNLAIARIHLANRRFEEAGKQLNLAVNSPEPRNRALALAFRASSSIARGDAKAGKVDALLALETYKSIGSPFGSTLAHQLASMACEDLGDLSGAVFHLEKALETLESWRSELQTAEFIIGTQDGLQMLVGRGASLYSRLGMPQKAFEFVQRAKASSLRMANTELPTPSSLRPGEVLIEFASSGDELVVMIVQPGKPVQSIIRPWPRSEMRRDIQALNSSIARGKPVVPASLTANVIAPLASYIRIAKRLIVCPDDYLNIVPFGCLKFEGRLLIEWAPLTVAPSASVWLSAIMKAPNIEPKPTSSIVLAISNFEECFGKALFRGGLAPLPMARMEAEVVRKSLRGMVLFDRYATKSALLRRPISVDVLHVATHTIANRTDPTQLALVLTPAGPADSGLVYPRDILGSRLKCRLAVLSACTSLAGPIRTGEGVQNFSWAFLSAGCPRTISTLWSIDDRAAFAFAREFYPRYARTGDAALSLQRACLALRSSREFANPRHWAGWVLTGSSR